MTTRPSENIDCQAPSTGSLQSETRIRNGGSSRDKCGDICRTEHYTTTSYDGCFHHHLTTLSERFGLFFSFFLLKKTLKKQMCFENQIKAQGLKQLKFIAFIIAEGAWTKLSFHCCRPKKPGSLSVCLACLSCPCHFWLSTWHWTPFPLSGPHYRSLI